MTDKAIVILTNFWNANYLINCGFAIFPCDKDKYYKINLSQKDNNYTVLSIALRHPPLDDKLPHLRNLNTLSFFCPTYNMLSRYKKDGDWDIYTKDYKSLLRKRKEDIRDWINSLDSSHVYILCCWENTSLKAKCHRQIIYEAFKASTLAKEKILPFYCDGDKKMSFGSQVANLGRVDVSNDLFGDPVPTVPGNYVVSDINPNAFIYYTVNSVPQTGIPPSIFGYQRPRRR